MKLSLIIPTRNRCEYLGYCLATCLAPADKDIELIVSDNNSEDRTREVVAGISDGRVRYFNTGKSLSMRQNYEFALGQATGDYLMIIGDDDGLLSNGLQTLRFLIDKYKPDVINWRTIDYKWPRTQPVPQNGVLKFSSRYFFGPIERKDPREILSALCEARTLQYRDGANLYHGCVARRVIEALRMKTQEYFQAHNPDVYSSLANLSVAHSFLWINNPITIGGESEKSLGAAGANRQAMTARQAEVSADFRALADADPVAAEMSMKVRIIIAHTYAVLNRVNKLLYQGRLDIDHGKWRDAILKDVARTSPDLQEVYERLLVQLFTDADPQYHYKASAIRSPPSQQEAPARAAVVVDAKKARGRNIAPQHTKTVAAVAEWIDTVTGAPYFPMDSSALTRLWRLWKVIDADFKARCTK